MCTVGYNAGNIYSGQSRRKVSGALKTQAKHHGSEPVAVMRHNTSAPGSLSQAISDLFESVALQQTALSHILNGEGEKLQKLLSFEDVTYETVLKANRSVESMVTQ